MEFVNTLNEHISREQSISQKTLKEAFSTLCILISPFAPHIAEELWEIIGNKPSILDQPWPTYNNELIKKEEKLIVVQINGKLRHKVIVPAFYEEEEIKTAVLNEKRIKDLINNKKIKKIIYIKDKLINIVL